MQKNEILEKLTNVKKCRENQFIFNCPVCRFEVFATINFGEDGNVNFLACANGCDPSRILARTELPADLYNTGQAMQLFDGSKEIIAQKIRGLEAERENLEDETRLDLFCLPDLYPNKNEREWEHAFLESNFESESKRIDKELRKLKFYLPEKRRRKPDSGRISSAEIERARQVPCEELLGPAVRKSGKHLWLNCPLHDDANPSLSVNSENYWCCWAGCGKGDVIDLYMRLHSVDFISAVRDLAKGEEP